MKIGSIWYCTDNSVFRMDKFVLVKPPIETPLTLRSWCKYHGIYLLYFEELVNGMCNTGEECGYDCRYFREIQFPPSLEAEIQEALTREFEMI